MVADPSASHRVVVGSPMRVAAWTDDDVALSSDVGVARSGPGRCSSLRTGETGTAERSDPTMNALAIVYVNEHLQELADGAKRHPSRVPGPSLRQRIASAVSTFRS